MKRLVVRNLGLVNRCYSTISTQSTVSYNPQPKSISISPKPTPSTSTSTIKASIEKPTPFDIKEKIVNLQRCKNLFKDEHGLFGKIDLLVQQLRRPDTPIRVGIIGSKKTLLDTVLADPFATDQSWYDQLLERPKNVVLKYSNDFEISEKVYNIPAPVLSTHNLELIELENLGQYNDGCHLYLNFANSVDPKWPTYELQDEDVEIPGTNEINSKLAYEAISLLKESPLNSTTYTKLYNASNFPHFNNTLNKLLISESVITKLYKSIVKNLQTQNIHYSMTLEELDFKDLRIKEYISQWSESAHREFQTSFQPFVTKFEAEQLAWWKLYYKNDDIETILINMLNSGFLNDSLKNFSYVKGQIDSFSSFSEKNEEKLEKISSKLDQNALTQLKNQIIEEDLIPIQNKVIKLLVLNFVGLQLPVALVSAGGYFLYGFSFYSMFGLGSLGLVLGFNNISKKWLEIITQFKTNLFEKTRLGILKTNEQLYTHWSAKYDLEKTQILDRLQLIKSLEK